MGFTDRGRPRFGARGLASLYDWLASTVAATAVSHPDQLLSQTAGAAGRDARDP